jgi:hypothetical protein
VTPRHTLAAGLALIVATNAVVLGGVAYNRSGEPDAQLRLTEREFHIPYTWGFWRENSGLEMRLQWRVLPRGPGREEMIDYGYGGYASEADWLDRAKLVDLGFDLSRPPRADDRYYSDVLPRDVLLVLEVDGPAYREALQRAERRAAALQAKLAAMPMDAQIKNALSASGKLLADARERHSRLFVVDAGLDRAALRAKYPDRSRHAVVPGQIRLGTSYYERNTPPRVVGRVTEISVAQINVPLELRPVIATGATFEATVAFGRRLEPWFVSAAARPKRTAE